jgi:hypothetical protein
VVVEVRLELDIATIQSRSAIYHRCLDAVRQHHVRLTRVECVKKEHSGLQCVVCFEVQAAA